MRPLRPVVGMLVGVQLQKLRLIYLNSAVSPRTDRVQAQAEITCEFNVSTFLLFLFLIILLPVDSAVYVNYRV